MNGVRIISSDEILVKMWVPGNQLWDFLREAESLFGFVGVNIKRDCIQPSFGSDIRSVGLILRANEVSIFKKFAEGFGIVSEEREVCEFASPLSSIKWE